MKRPSHDQRGYHCLATNAINNTSEVGQAIAKRSGTFSLTFFIKGDEAICSLRSIAPFDVSVIATHFGGGGHAQASGFTVPIKCFFSEIFGGDDSGLKTIPWALDG